MIGEACFPRPWDGCDQTLGAGCYAIRYESVTAKPLIDIGCYAVTLVTPGSTPKRAGARARARHVCGFQRNIVTAWLNSYLSSWNIEVIVCYVWRYAGVTLSRPRGAHSSDLSR